MVESTNISCWARPEERRVHATTAAALAVLCVALLGVAALLTPSAAAQTTGQVPVASAPRVSAVDAIVLPVSDMDRSVEFFSKVLTFQTLSDVEVMGGAYERLEGVFGLRMRVVRMKLGDETLELAQYLAPEGRPLPVDSRSNDHWFQHIAIVVTDMDRAYARLREFKVRHTSTGPQRLPDWNAAAGGIKAFYFKDPDGHALEVIWFPEGKGDPKWRDPRRGDNLFLGIDHTAIVVSDTEASLRLYRDVLGMRVAGAAENYGTEQEHLNSVSGARLRITGLRAGAGPGVEFLEYLAPTDGRPTPVDVRSNDMMGWQVRFTSPDARAAEAGLRAARTRMVSPGLIQTSDASLGFVAGMVVRDPDGHAIEIVQESR